MKQMIWILFAYLIGSIPWGLVIGKVFFHTDIREYGSGNLGGTNAGRVLGTRFGILVIFLDGLKSLLVMILCHKFCIGMESYCGLAVCLGHCFPIFAGFRGGKAVACSYGYLLGLSLFETHRIILTFILPIIIFFAVLLICRMVSLSSICGVVSAALIVFFFIDRKTGIMLAALAVFVIYRHKANIQRIIQGNESKITLFKKINRIHD